MDLNDLTPKKDTLTVELKHPFEGTPLENDDGSLMTIEVYAPYSKEYRAALHRQTNRRIEKANKKKGSIELPRAEEIEQSAIELLSEVTKGWNITYDGKKPKFDTEKAKEVYEKVFWIREQIEEAQDEHQDFTKG